MKLVISHISAAEFWRKVYPAGRAPQHGFSSCTVKPDEIALSAKDIQSLTPTWATKEFLAPEQGILHVLSFRKGDGRQTSNHQCHVHTGILPPGSLYALNEDVFVCSPEFVFLQLAQSLSRVQLIAYGYELCGTFSFDASAERGFTNRKQPLVNIRQLTGFLQNAEGARGRKRALDAVAFISENAASPMEAACDMLLSLPYRLGGYGLPKLQLNYAVPIPPKLQTLFPHSYCVVDFCYPEKKFAIEYLGEHDHSGRNSMRSDRGRTLALRELRFEVLEVSARQVLDLGSFEIIARRVAQVSGKRIRFDQFGETDARMNLRLDLANWSARSGIAS